MQNEGGRTRSFSIMKDFIYKIRWIDIMAGPILT